MTPEYRDAPAQQSADRKLFAGDNSEDLFILWQRMKKNFESIKALLSIRNLLSGLDSHEKDTGNKEDHGNDEQDNRWGDFVFHKKSFPIL